MSTDQTTSADLDAACLTAHGEGPAGDDRGVLVAIFAGPVAHELLLMGARTGYRIALVEPDDDRRGAAAARIPGLVSSASVDEMPLLGDDADVVMTDHHRDELGPLLQALLAADTRWIGLMGNARHEGPHIAALQQLGVPQVEIDRVRRPIGLNIGSHAPAEIAISTLAGLIAEHNGRPGGFAFG